MKSVTKLSLFSLIMAGLMVLGINSAALAAGTISGTNIENTATINYDVGTVSQTPIESSPTGNSTPGAGNGTATSFVVDNRVDLTVAEVNGIYTEVVPGAANQWLVFEVANTGNTVQDFVVTALDYGTDPFGGTENFDAVIVEVYVDANSNGVYDPAIDTATFVDELAPDATATVFVVADIPASQASGDIAAYTLTAATHDGGNAGSQGAATVATVGADTAGVDIVFGDSDGETDAAEDGIFSAAGAYQVLSAQLSIQKIATVIHDPFNDITNPKSIPGAYIQYVITVSNAAGAGGSANLTTITDVLDTSTAIDPDLAQDTAGTPESGSGFGFKVDISGTGRAAAATPLYFTTAADVDGIDYDGTDTVNASMSLVLPAETGYAAGELQAGESVTITFNVIVQ